MEGLTSSELAMIKKLAGNDAVVRKKTMKKLKIWLTAIATRLPETGDCRPLIENNFLRVWKALFYCMWMADKPLPQEQLADQISALVDVFSAKPMVMNLFVEWFFRTMAREWPYIDTYRMDKFGMLVRRFLRKVLQALEQQKWKKEVLDGFLRVISVNIFNRHPEVKATRSSARVPGIEVAPLGLQTHIIDIFLEELAKIGGNSLKNKKILKIITPFVHEICYNDDDRVLNDLKVRIFWHLMQQSDVGIDYAEGISGDEINGEDVSDGEDDEEVDEEDQMLEEELENIGPLDPRAGAVDVVLPQLNLDYEELADKLVKAGGQKNVKAKNRKMAYLLAKQFKELSEGKYPLALKDDDDVQPAIPPKLIEKAAQRLLQFEEGIVGSEKKMRKSKKSRKRLAKKSQIQDLDVSNGSESDNTNSFYLEDNELLDHVGDNYMSYLEELHQEQNGKTNGTSNRINENSVEAESSPKATLKKLKRRRTSKIPNGVAEEDDEEAEDIVTPLRKTLKQRKSLNSEPSESTPVSAKKKMTKARLSLPAVGHSNLSDAFEKEAVANGNGTPGTNQVPEHEEEVHVLLREKPRKRKTISKIQTIDTPQTPGTPSSTKKRVSFVLARNLQHEHSDYEQSINRSPAVPFDSAKKPVVGLLKSPKSPASSMFFNGLQSTPRRKSGRF